MGAISRIFGERHYVGAVAFLDTVSLPDGTVDDDTVIAAAGISASKIEQQYPLNVVFGTTEIPTTHRRLLHIARGAGSLLSVEAAMNTLPSSAAQVEVTVLKSISGSTGTAMTSADVVLSSTCTARVMVAGTVGSTAAAAYADGDIIMADIQASTGTVGAGLVLTVMVREDA